MKIISFQPEKKFKEFDFDTIEGFDYCFLQAMRYARKMYIRDTMVDDMYLLQLYVGKLRYQTILYMEGFGDLWFKWRQIIEKELSGKE